MMRQTADIDAIKTKLRNVNWSFIQNLSDINEINRKFTKILIDAANEAIPKKEFLIGLMTNLG